ncbi:tRNA-dihydrouridine synthase [Halobacteriovorax sp. HLS]|uniref:tRNA dihydrouridine synthase n=1 Tax=Halobacteriovorax sp. HLS TaxID=2234000 RepID=UPI0013E39AB5|nr:tRNA-dihydrouridine synthase family protein [Halobacteriovorax sp. HLS]
MRKLPFKERSLLFAPMEGVTDEPYRIAIDRAFPEWDYLCTDFLRVPTVGKFSNEKILSHYGHKVLANSQLRKKTGFQILTSYRAQTEDTVKKIEAINEITHLDLNLGCPSKKVNAHKGGAYLLSEMKELREIIQIIRKNYSKTFTVKIRIGYKNTDKFFDSLKLFEDEGVDAITIHGRTRDELYRGIANWDYIKKAVQSVSIPVIGNGDVWTLRDIDRMFTQVGCDSIMLGRGALKTPWLATLYNQYRDNYDELDDDFLLEERKKYLQNYFDELEREYKKVQTKQVNVLNRFKSFSRYLFDDFQNGDAVRSSFQRAESLDHFKDLLYGI